MEFESKILSKNISELLYNSEKTLGTAESCTGGRIAEAIISVPGASNYFKGGIVSYTNEVKENILKVSHEVLEEQTAVCEEVAREMVLGAIDALKVDFAFRLPVWQVLQAVQPRYLLVPSGLVMAARTMCVPSSLPRITVATSISLLPPILPSSLCTASSRSAKKT